MKPSKYRNQRVECDGIHFDSKKERDRYQELRLLERAKQISALTLQPKFDLIVSNKKVGFYKADFSYEIRETGDLIVEDVKGVRTPVYKLKKKLVEAIYGIQVKEV